MACILLSFNLGRYTHTDGSVDLKVQIDRTDTTSKGLTLSRDEALHLLDFLDGIQGILACGMAVPPKEEPGS